MRCPECDGTMYGHKHDIGRERRPIIEWWAECEDCGYQRAGLDAYDDAREDELEARVWH